MFKNDRSRIICIIEIECVEISLEKIQLGKHQSLVKLVSHNLSNLGTLYPKALIHRKDHTVCITDSNRQFFEHQINVLVSYVLISWIKSHQGVFLLNADSS